MSKNKPSLKERLAEKKKELAKKGQGGGFILKQKEEGTMRLRLLPTGEDNDIAFEATAFWLGEDNGEVISPSTFGEPCAIMEKYEKLKKSKDDEDLDLAKKLVPRKKYIIPVIIYSDDKGKKIDTNLTPEPRLFQIAPGTYQDIIDLYLDSDEWGDMTDRDEGYDIKIIRTGKGKNDTKYNVTACKNTPLAKEFRKTKIDLEAMVRAKTSSYEETLDKLNKFLGTDYDDEDEERSRKKKSSKTKTSSKDKSSRDEKLKKKKRNRDI